MVSIYFQPTVQEDKLKELLKHEVVNKKKEIYTSVEATIQNAMASSYEGEVFKAHIHKPCECQPFVETVETFE